MACGRARAPVAGAGAGWRTCRSLQHVLYCSLRWSVNWQPITIAVITTFMQTHIIVSADTKFNQTCNFKTMFLNAELTPQSVDTPILTIILQMNRSNEKNSGYVSILNYVWKETIVHCKCIQKRIFFYRITKVEPNISIKVFIRT